eukprot:4255801-Pleurochrysis_carterae.AAC.1
MQPQTPHSTDAHARSRAYEEAHACMHVRRPCAGKHALTWPSPPPARLPSLGASPEEEGRSAFVEGAGVKARPGDWPFGTAVRSDVLLGLGLGLGPVLVILALGLR